MTRTKLITVIFYVASAAATTGCVATVPYAPHSEDRSFRGPPLRATHTATVGEAMITAYNHHSQIGATVDLQPISSDSFPGAARQVGSQYFGNAQGGKPESRYANLREVRMNAGGFAYCGSVQGNIACFSDPNDDRTFEKLEWFSPQFSELGEFDVKAPYTTDFHVIDDPSAFRKELIYQGRGTGTMHVVYREYSGGDLIRPAYSQQLTYELEDSGAEIAFQSVRVRVLSADNTSVRYEVLSNF
ncbi:hypothetical protein [Algiphilus sp.]|uniref:hypothetical protein n=1 Tax=Algiphilus sp. TaxID=1872431 RepID=UPI0025C0BE68|nr:hypothetical protein [Algiphilus sp.]MCK5769494.1 hypothetical protein [Algiphilus sp.]